MLTKMELNEIKSLQELCEKHDKIKLKLNWDMLEQRSSRNDDYFYHKEKMIGYLALYGFGDKYEICGMVHPLYRGQGIFTGLLNEGIKSLRARHASSLLINVPGTSHSGKTFASSINAQYDFTEYEMKWDPESQLPTSEKVMTREMKEADIPYSIKLDIECFGQSRSDAEAMLKQSMKESGQKSLMIVADGNTVGKIRVQRVQEQSFIYGFAVDPYYQGKGIGRKALAHTVREESRWTQDIFLDVAATNNKALNLYEKSGFKTTYSQDYYQFNI
jgi:ribosomal protein S18 acetylase RimI-like enzyme